MNVNRSNRSIRFSGTRFFIAIGLFCFFLSGCENKKTQTAADVIQTSLNAVGKEEARKNVKNLVSLADCVSPSGKYSTEIHTSIGGYSYFKQVYTYKPKPFEAVIENKDSGYIIGDSLIALSKEAISMIRGHEFQNIILEVDKRYHDFEKPQKIETKGVITYWIKAKDELNNRCSLFFDPKTGLLSAIHSQNPADSKEIIETEFSDWQQQQQLLLPKHIDIKRGEKRYSFDFTKVLFNSPDFKMISTKIKNR